MTVSGFAGDPDRYKPLTRIFIYLPQGGEVDGLAGLGGAGGFEDADYGDVGVECGGQTDPGAVPVMSTDAMVPPFVVGEEGRSVAPCSRRVIGNDGPAPIKFSIFFLGTWAQDRG